MTHAPRHDPTSPPSQAGLRWEDLVRRLVGYARRLGASVEEAEDLVQDTLEVAVRDPAWFDPGRAGLPTVLSTVLRNRLVDRRRHGAVVDRAAPKLRLVPPAEGPHDALAAADAKARRHALLALLTRDERQVFGAWLRQRRRELTGPDAAASIGMGNAEYESAKKRLRRRCHALLDELGIDTADLFGGDR